MFRLSDIRQLAQQQFKALGKEGTLARNIAYVFSGKMLVTVAGFLLMPILSRILDQEAFGIFGVLNHMVSILAVMIGMRLGDTFILNIDQAEFLRIKRVVYTNIFTLGGLIMLLLVFFGDALFVRLGIEVPGWVRFIIAPMIIINALKEAQGNQMRRIKAFKQSTAINSGMDLGSRLLAIALGLWVTQTFVAILAKEVVRVSFTLLIAYKQVLSKVEDAKRFSLAGFSEVKAVLKKYSRFPKFEMPAALAGMLYASLPLYLLGPEFGIDSVGDFTMVQTMLFLPTFVITNSLVSVIQTSAAKLLDTDPQKLRSLIALSLTGMCLVSSLGMGLVIWYGEGIFAFFLGSNWASAGIMGSIMAPLFLIRMLAPILESLRVIIGTQKFNLLFRSLGVILTLVVIMGGIAIGKGLHEVLLYFTISNCLLLLVSMSSVLVKLKSNILKIFLSLILTAAFGIGLAYLIGLPFT